VKRQPHPSVKKRPRRPDTIPTAPMIASDDAAPIIVGIDTGGTFTDLVAIVGGELRVHKLPSTPHDPAAAVITGLMAILNGASADAVTYSSTVATNALLEKKGARVALFVDAGFEDLIEIGRQNRTALYALAPERPEPLVPRALRFGVSGRTYFDGKIARPLTTAELARVRKLADRSGAEAFAVCLLHSYANPTSENALARALEPLGRSLSVSHRILAEYREFERLSTTVVNAHVAPRMVAHLENLEKSLSGARLRVMQSNGYAIGTQLARDEPVRTILSGPAAGVVGAGELVHAMGVDRFITFDMGGTSTDVSLFDGAARIRSLSYPNGYAVRTPVIDIHTVGAGGGSIATMDAGGSLKVGPESAGANPGPACYGRGNLPTVTDADLVAGRLVAENFLGGQMRLVPARADSAIAGLARAMATDAATAARGVIRVVNANMERAIRVITVERGYDPRDFALMAFGGAGPMHACELALDLGMRKIVMPRNPGLLCAWGALSAPLGREYSITVRETAPELSRLLKHAEPLVARARAELTTQGAKAAAIKSDLRADVRYRGQSYEIEVPLGPKFAQEFHAAHKRTFGYAAADAPIEVVNIRLRASAAAGRPITPARIAKANGKPVPSAKAGVIVGTVRRSAPVYARENIGAGARIDGPAIVVELSATTYVSPEFTLRCDDFGNLHLEMHQTSLRAEQTSLRGAQRNTE
jgi:N-methylhydantoinase A/oxoprolinase/acetone carboxylase beta subunit